MRRFVGAQQYWLLYEECAITDHIPAKATAVCFLVTFFKMIDHRLRFCTSTDLNDEQTEASQKPQTRQSAHLAKSGIRW